MNFIHLSGVKFRQPVHFTGKQPFRNLFAFYVLCTTVPSDFSFGSFVLLGAEIISPSLTESHNHFVVFLLTLRLTDAGLLFASNPVVVNTFIFCVDRL